TGESSALVRSADGGPPLPPGRKVRTSDSGVGGAPTLLSNAETFAQLAVAARTGADRYCRTGLRDEPGTVLLTLSGAVARPMVVEVPTGVPLQYVLQLAGAPALPQGVLTGGYHGRWLDGVTAHDAVVSRASLDACGGALGAGAILPIGEGTCPLGESLRVAHWLAAESSGQCGPCYLGLPAAARGLSDVLQGGGPTALEALREVTRAVKRRGACKHPDGSAAFLESSISAFTDDLAAHVLGGGCGRPVEGVLPLQEDTPPAEAPSGRTLAVDWTLCQGHGLCADIVPELIQLGPDGFPSVAEASVPRYSEARATRAVRRCPALALRIEEAPKETSPSRTALPAALPAGRSRRALGSGRQ
ncbi:oxidoreductase, partial [Streptomyces sp. SID10115]